MSPSGLSSRVGRLVRDEKLARLAGFGWGFAEGLFFFIVPDVYISLAALFSLRAGVAAWFSSIAGSIVAVSVVYVLVAILGVDYLTFVESVPGISGALVKRVAGMLATEGLPWSPLLALGGVPLKLYVALAFFLGTALGPVLLWTIFARIVRIAPTVAGAAVMRRLFRRSIDARPVLWAALVIAFWFLFYVFYFIQMSRIG